MDLSIFTRLLLAMLLALVPRAALGCAVCGFGAGDSQLAYLITTGIMTFVPLLFMGGVFYYLHRRISRSHDDHA